MVRQKTAFGLLAVMGGGVVVSSVAGTTIPLSDYVIDLPGYAIMLILGLSIAGVF